MKRDRGGNISSPGLRRHPAMAATLLGTATALGFASGWLLLGSAERTIEPLRRRSRLIKPRRQPSFIAGSVIASVGVTSAFVLLDAILNHPRVQRLDRHLHNHLRQQRTKRMKKMVELTTSLGSTETVASLAALSAFGLVLRRKDRDAIAMAWNVIGSSALSEILKNVVQCQRPPEGEKKERSV